MKLSQAEERKKKRNRWPKARKCPAIFVIRPFPFSLAVLTSVRRLPILSTAAGAAYDDLIATSRMRHAVARVTDKIRAARVIISADRSVDHLQSAVDVICAKTSDDVMHPVDDL